VRKELALPAFLAVEQAQRHPRDQIVPRPARVSRRPIIGAWRHAV
jgi:hypothetical protein